MDSHVLALNRLTAVLAGITTVGCTVLPLLERAYVLMAAVHGTDRQPPSERWDLILQELTLRARTPPEEPSKVDVTLAQLLADTALFLAAEARNIERHAVAAPLTEERSAEMQAIADQLDDMADVLLGHAEAGTWDEVATTEASFDPSVREPVESASLPSNPRAPMRRRRLVPMFIAMAISGISSTGILVRYRERELEGLAFANPLPLVLVTTCSSSEPRPYLAQQQLDTRILADGVARGLAAVPARDLEHRPFVVAYWGSASTGKSTAISSLLHELWATGPRRYSAEKALAFLDATLRGVPKQPSDDPLAAIRAAVDGRQPGIAVVVSSGLDTSDPQSLLGIDRAASPAAAVEQLRRDGSLPDLTGWHVSFTGVGEGGRRLDPCARDRLTRLWRAILEASGAISADVEFAESSDLQGSRISLETEDVVSSSMVTGPSRMTQALRDVLRVLLADQRGWGFPKVARIEEATSQRDRIERCLDAHVEWELEQRHYASGLRQRVPDASLGYPTHDRLLMLHESLEARVRADVVAGARQHQRLPGPLRWVPVVVAALDSLVLYTFFAAVYGVSLIASFASTASLAAVTMAVLGGGVTYTSLALAGTRLRAYRTPLGDISWRTTGALTRALLGSATLVAGALGVVMYGRVVTDVQSAVADVSALSASVLGVAFAVIAVVGNLAVVAFHALDGSEEASMLGRVGRALARWERRQDRIRRRARRSTARRLRSLPGAWASNPPADERSPHAHDDQPRSPAAADKERPIGVVAREHWAPVGVASTSTW